MTNNMHFLVRKVQATTLFILLCCNLTSCSGFLQGEQTKEQQIGTFFVGSYTDNAEQGIYLVSYDPMKQQLTNEKLLASRLNPSYLNWQPSTQRLYGIANTAEKSNLVEVFEWNVLQQKLQLIQSHAVSGKGSCHLNVNHDQTALAVVNYSSGDSTLFDISLDQQPLTQGGYFKNEGKSITNRQTSPHLHFAGWGNQNKYLYITDLGTDEILVFDNQSENFEPKHRVKLSPGDGPRHLAFHPTQPFIYSVNELSNSISVFSQNAETGLLRLIDNMATQSKSLSASSSAIRISQDGRHLYIAIRGENALYGYAIQPNGRLTFINKVETGGDHPRDFNFSINQNYLLVANQHSDQLNLIQRDITTGELSLTEVQLGIHKPSFVQAFR